MTSSPNRKVRHFYFNNWQSFDEQPYTQSKRKINNPFSNSTNVNVNRNNHIERYIFIHGRNNGKIRTPDKSYKPIITSIIAKIPHNVEVFLPDYHSFVALAQYEPASSELGVISLPLRESVLFQLNQWKSWHNHDFKKKNSSKMKTGDHESNSNVNYNTMIDNKIASQFYVNYFSYSWGAAYTTKLLLYLDEDGCNTILDSAASAILMAPVYNCWLIEQKEYCKKMFQKHASQLTSWKHDLSQFVMKSKLQPKLKAKPATVSISSNKDVNDGDEKKELELDSEENKKVYRNIYSTLAEYENYKIGNNIAVLGLYGVLDPQVESDSSGDVCKTLSKYYDAKLCKILTSYGIKDGNHSGIHQPYTEQEYIDAKITSIRTNDKPLPQTMTRQKYRNEIADVAVKFWSQHVWNAKQNNVKTKT